jgi:hypothetical protein
VHEALPRELPHTRVDNRHSGATLLPSLQILGVTTPAIAPGPVVEARQRGGRSEDLMMKITPAELADEGLGPRPALGTRHCLGRRKAAEVKVGREP